MLISSFKSYTSVAIFKIPALALLLWAFAPIYSHVLIPGDAEGMPLYTSIARALNAYYYLSCFAALTLCVVSAFLLNYIVNQHSVLPKKTYLPALFYLIYSSFCGELLHIHPMSFVNLLLISACHELFDTYRKDSALPEYFNAGLLIGLASLLYFPSCLLFLFICVSMILFRPFIWQEYFVSALGLLLPWAYTVVYFLWNDRLGNFWHGHIHSILSPKQFYFPGGPAAAWLYTVLGIMLLLSLIRLVNGHVIPPLKSKKTLSLLFWCFLLSISTLALSNLISFSALEIAAVPLAVFSANLFIQIKKNWLAEALFGLVLIAIVILHLSTFKGH
jgi:hypothetical protein